MRSRKVLRQRRTKRAWLSTWKPTASLVAFTFLAALAVPVHLAAQENRHSRYILKDLPRLGGPNSYFPSQPIIQFVNNGGAVTGVSDTQDINPSCTQGDCYVQHGFLWRDGNLTDLKPLPGGMNSVGFWINEPGVILGSSDNGIVDPLTGLLSAITVFWIDGQIVELPTLGGGINYGNAMNNRSQVVGIAQNTNPDPFSFIGIGYAIRGVIWEGGTIRELGDLGGLDSWGAFINEHGQVVGWSSTSAVADPSIGGPPVHPFLWENGVMQDLGTLGGKVGIVGSFAGGGGAINGQGQVIGTSTLPGDQTFHPYLWEDGAIHDLGTLGGKNGQAYWINNSGGVVGRADFSPDSDNHHAFLWRKGVMSDLGTLGTFPCSTALDINSSGQIIGDTGICGQGGGPPFISENGSPMIDLNTLVNLPASGLRLYSASFINDRGEITASGFLPDGSEHDVLLIPCGAQPQNVECESKPANEQSTPSVSHHPAGSLHRGSEANQGLKRGIPPAFSALTGTRSTR